MFHTEKPATQIAHLVFADTQDDLKKPKEPLFPKVQNNNNLYFSDLRI